MVTHTVRSPVCADDRWYPSDPSELRQWIGEFLTNVPDQPIDGDLIGLIAPHAGYAFSGQTAAYAYKQLQGRSFRRVIVLGPSHYGDYGTVAINQSGSYRTPLGEIPIDADAVMELSRRVGVHFVARDQEHSLEMQLPFLQYQLGSFKLLPIMMSHPFYIVGARALAECERLAEALAQLMDEQTLLVASSDLSHLHDYDAVTYFDQVLANLIEEYDIHGLVRYMSSEGEFRACGDTAIIALLLTAQRRGANRVRVLYHTTSGDVTGVRAPGQYTVGYMAAAVYRSNE